MLDTQPDVSELAMRSRWNERYAEGVTPWDTGITPPEVVEFWKSGRLPPHGRALDLGCGPATNTRFLARIGLITCGIEIADQPLQLARQRSADDPPSMQARMLLLCADVTALPFSNFDAAYVLDIGCLHTLPDERREDYGGGLVTNLRPGGYYHLFSFDRPTEVEVAEPNVPRRSHGIDSEELALLLSPHFTLIEETIGKPDTRPCRWTLWKRIEP